MNDAGVNDAGTTPSLACPRCGAPMPLVSAVASGDERVLTCPSCGNRHIVRVSPENDHD